MNKWSKAHRQARAIGKAKTDEGKRRSVLAWCRKIREALNHR